MRSQEESKKKKRFVDTDDEGSEEEEKIDEEDERIDLKRTIIEGSFLPVVALLKQGSLNVEDMIDEGQGLRLIHYACYFGKIKALRCLVEIFNADVNATDYRGQTPLHVASVSGELGPLLYLSSQSACAKDTKDNALMTPLMNTVSSGHSEAFVFLHFAENCDLGNLDMNGA